MGNAPTVQVAKEEVMREAAQKTLTDPDNPSNPPVTFESLYKDSPGPVVVKFFRRFGCVLCREGAAETMKLKPLLDEKYGKGVVNWIGIGLEKLGYDEFKEGNYFPGKIYLDESHELYTTAGFNKIGMMGIVSRFVTEGTISLAKEAEKKGFHGDLKGNKTQLGGWMIVSPKGELLFYYQQKAFGDEPAKEEVLKAIEDYFAVANKEKN